MKAGSINLQKIFEQTICYRVPLFQRPYVWDVEDNWEPMWHAIRDLSERYMREGKASPYFLGAIVLDQMQGPTGTIEARQVIDGQQRLTTLQLLMAVLRDLAVYCELPKYASRFEKLTINDESFQDEPDDAFKVWPTNRDREDYRKTMTAGSTEKLYELYDVSSHDWIGSQIPDAYLYFWEQVGEWIEENNAAEEGEDLTLPELEACFESLWAVIRNHLQIVAIDLEDDDDAQIIFETLNNYGTQLSPADLVKNYLFRQAELEHAPIEQYYDKYWSDFDDNFWREEIRQGRLKRPRIDLFLQHYLTLKTHDEVNTGHIFATFTSYADRATKPSNDPADSPVKQTVQDHLAQLRDYGKVFRKFQDPPDGTRAAVFFDRLESIDTTTVIPFLLAAFHELDKGRIDDLNQILIDLESFLTRRMICGLTNKNYNRLFLDLIRDCETAGQITVSGMRAFLAKLEGDSVRWPNDDEMLEAFLSRPAYTTLSQAKLRMVLQALDSAMETGKSEEIVYTSKLTIEHLMPQKWQAHWPLPAEDDPAEFQKMENARQSALHTIGNLTLLTQKLNPSVSNSDWKSKRPEILKHSKLNMNRYFQEIQAWNEEEIEKRGRELFHFAKSVWPHPISK